MDGNLSMANPIVYMTKEQNDELADKYYAQKERIVCSAIWYKDLPAQNYLPVNCDAGIVVCGLRHAHCIAAFNALSGLRSVTTEAGNYVQGFLTNMNRFVNRDEADKIALECGQVTELSYLKDELDSSDLY